MACCVMAMLVSILGLWANKNTFINRNDTSGEMLDSLDARDISLRLEDQSVHTFHNPAHLQYCQGEVLASTQFYGNESLHSNSTIGMSVFERSVEAPFVALFALWIFVVMPVLLSDMSSVLGAERTALRDPIDSIESKIKKNPLPN